MRVSEIVVGVNIGGPAGLRAVRWAAERASARGIRLRLVHVADEAMPESADAAVRQLFLGAGVLMAQSEPPPADLVDVFLEYRGTTAAGLSAMIEADIASPIFRGLSAARRRAEEGLL